MKIAWGSCVNAVRLQSAFYRVVTEGAVAYFSQGDAPYTDGTRTAWGISATNSGQDQSVANMRQHFLQLAAEPAFAYMRRNRAHRYMWDDHELPGGDWDHTIEATQFPPGNVTPAPTTQAEVDAIFANCRDAAEEFFADNPVNTDPLAAPDKPNEAEAPASAYPVRYFRESFGDMEVFQLDCISSRSALADPDNAAKVMIGANQLAWLKDALLNSTATWKLISSSKKTYIHSGPDNGDTWNEYQTQRDEIFAFIDSNNIKGVGWMTSDRHTPEVMTTRVADGDARDHIDVCACPVGTLQHTSPGTPGPQTRIMFPGTGQVFGVVEPMGEHLKWSIRDVLGRYLWSGFQHKDSNTIADVQMAVAA